MLIDLFYVVRDIDGIYVYDSGPHKSYEYAHEAKLAHKWTHDKYSIAKETVELSIFSDPESEEI